MGGRQALEAVHNGNQNVFDAPDAQIVHHQEPKLGPFGIGTPQAQNLLFAIWGDAQGNINRFVFDLMALRIADFDRKRVKEDNRIHWLQSTVMPVRDLFQINVCHPADKISRNAQSVDFFQKGTDIACQPSRRIKREYPKLCV